MAKLALIFDVVYIIDNIDPDNPPEINTEEMIKYLTEKGLDEPRMLGLTRGVWCKDEKSHFESINVSVGYDEIIYEED